MVHNRASLRSALSALALLVITGCSEQQFNAGFEDDSFAPSISIIKTIGDTLDVADGIQFGINAADNLGLKNITIALTGGFSLIIDTTFSTAITDVALAIEIPLAENTTAGGDIFITATATDGNNLTQSDTDSVFLRNEDALTVRVQKPNPGALTSAGLQIIVELLAEHSNGVESVGYVLTGVVSDSAGQSFSSPLPDSVVFVDTLTIPGGTSEGTFVVQGFATDSTGRFALSSPVTVTVQSIANDQDPPLVSFQIGARVEVDDSIAVLATDPSGIGEIGWTARNLAGALIGGDSVTLAGTLTDVTQRWEVALAVATLPQAIVIEGFAVDGNGNRGTSNDPSPSPAPGAMAAIAQQSDTVIVVNGITRPLPDGGRVVDAIYNRNLNEVYLTNITLSRVEIFQVVDTTFVAGGMNVGSQPWGIALWPRNSTTGTSGDSIVVANSGGTDLSIVDLTLRREVRRHALPNFLIQLVSTELDPATNVIQLKIREFDFSDRPQYLGMTCRPGVGACAADQIIAVYSTSPTIDQGTQPLRGSVRWENITSATPSSHFFWEQATVLPDPNFDTLQVQVDRGPVLGVEEVLSAACGIMVDLDQLIFRDTTFVRNSGDFTHAFVGEGGAVEGANFARAMGFNVTAGISTGVCSGNIIVANDTINFTGPFEIDDGVTPSIRVRDFISNTATTVNSIATNFNGLTNIVRTADTAFVLNEFLRLKGLVFAPGANNPGQDLNFDHDFEAGVGGTPGTNGGSGDPDDRLAFMASAQPQIDVFDTHFFAKVTSIAIRDPIIGPLRVARLPSGDQILIGVTAAGVVTVQLPPISNIFPSSGWGRQ